LFPFCTHRWRPSILAALKKNGEKIFKIRQKNKKWKKHKKQLQKPILDLGDLAWTYNFNITSPLTNGVRAHNSILKTKCVYEMIG